MNLKSFPHEQFQSLISLEKLAIRDCPSMYYSFPCGVWPRNLTKLMIGCLNKPMSEWGPQNYLTSLVELKGGFICGGRGCEEYYYYSIIIIIIIITIIIFSSSTISRFSNTQWFYGCEIIFRGLKTPFLPSKT
uniref:Uncharacterized protein n=1 Tax=Lactuca sativa TaxID=4236 RepID=A0A9R1WKY1_LACSA|nr:hypothetical protein LSAT_V11C100038900 [Lactuca sativa]